MMKNWLRKFRFEKTENSESGFTLVDVMVATLVLAISLLGTLRVFAQTSVFMEDLRNRSIANNAAQEEIELIRNMDFDNVLALDSPYEFTTSGFDQLSNPSGVLTLEDPL